MLAAAPAMPIRAGVSASAAPAITLVVRQAGAGDSRPVLAAGGMLAATTIPVLAQIRHCALVAVPFVTQVALTGVAHTTHCLGCAGWGAHRLQLQLYLTARPCPALEAEAGARAPNALITGAMGGADTGLAIGSKVPRGTEFTRCALKSWKALALPAATHAIQTHTMFVTGPAGTAWASSTTAAIVAGATAGLPAGGDTIAMATPSQVPELGSGPCTAHAL